VKNVYLSRKQEEMQISYVGG